MISRMFVLRTALGVALLGWTHAAVQADDDHGRGRGGHGNHSNNGSSFLGISPWGVSYGYQNDNFGLMVGPFGGGNVGHNHYHSGYPVYDPGMVAGPVYSSPAPVVDYGGYAPATRSPVAASSPSNVDAPIPEVANLSTGAATFYRQSVQAFRAGDYAAATRAADHAIVEDAQSGLLRIHASQCLMANGEFEAAAMALTEGLALISSDQWGEEVQNFRNLYRKNDYVTHMKQLEEFAKENPQNPTGHALCAYHFFYLGHESAAQRHLQAARKAEPDFPLVDQLGQVIPEAKAEELPAPAVRESKAEPRSILVGPK